MHERIRVKCLKKGTLDRKQMGLEDFRKSSLLEEQLFYCSPWVKIRTHIMICLRLFRFNSGMRAWKQRDQLLSYWKDPGLKRAVSL